ncbi:hypothetical protein DYI23_12870 [Roseibium polysiphoniae]|uniref:T4 beta protein n=1 Tax=Roseibium polysiphoniae TaxID=2571221 RepID=A0A944GU18_9HYPH|nr:hypothetical protein [Roseibium polysiphoniae]MBS8261111.1 hypothetical protein [Roseibium polysiphoniae]
MEFDDFTYVPILNVKPAEVQALEELSIQARNKLLPYIVLQPWSTAKEFVSTTNKVSSCTYGKNIIVDLTDDIFSGNRRPVHDVFDELRDSGNGYSAWREFVDGSEEYIPVVQLREPREIAPQIEAFKAMGRGVVIRLHEQIFPIARDIASLFRRYEDNSDVYFILDFQRQNRDILLKGAVALSAIRGIRSEIDDFCVSVSASTFPMSFNNIYEQDIYERRFYRLVADEIGFDRNLYCDRGSVRAERQNGGGGSPAPRIDNALAAKWTFYREADQEDRDEAYQMAAIRAINARDWLDKGIWGTEMIKRTAAGEEARIHSTKLSTAARINIHLHTQSGANDQVEEVEWEDL